MNIGGSSGDLWCMTIAWAPPFVLFAGNSPGATRLTNKRNKIQGYYGYTVRSRSGIWATGGAEVGEHRGAFTQAIAGTARGQVSGVNWRSRKACGLKLRIKYAHAVSLGLELWYEAK